MTLPHEREIGSELVGAMHHSTGSYELVFGAMVAAALGYGIDRWLGIVPLFTLLFAMVGFVVASYSILVSYRAQMHAASVKRQDYLNRAGS